MTSKAAPIGPNADKDEIPKTISCNKKKIPHETLQAKAQPFATAMLS